MKISYEWLKDYVEIKLKPEELARELTMAGLEVTSIEKIGSDSIMEFEITPNRPDCLSVIGIAREAAAITCKKLKFPNSKLKTQDSRLKPKVEIKDKDLCPLYTARIIEDIKVGPSPAWLVAKLEKMGLRSVNNVVDITNFCLFELGQPLHAFDYDKIKRGKIIVRRPAKGEKITTIDGKERELCGEELVIADVEHGLAIGGVMGSLNSEVTGSTKNILLESAYFDPVSVRRTSRRLGLVSESSYRFERSVDFGGVPFASDRAASLILELCGGKAGRIEHAGKSALLKKKDIPLRLSRLQAILGEEIEKDFIKKTFETLGLKVEFETLKVKSEKEYILKCTIPSYRQDLKSEIDLIEEAARIYGYKRFPSTTPPIVDQTQKRNFDFEGCEKRRKIQGLVRDTLASSGVNEIITYGLAARTALKDIDIDPETIVSIKNPLSLEQEIMRPSLLPGLLGVISRNLNIGIKDQKLFELGKVYLRDKSGFREEERLIIGFTGRANPFWLNRKEVDVFYLKGIAEGLFEKLGITDFSADIDDVFSAMDKGIPLRIGPEAIGILKNAPKELLHRFGIKTTVVICEIEIPKILPFVRLEKTFSDIIRYPSATRDISVIVDKAVPAEKVASIIKNTGGDLVKNVELFDEYRGEQIPAGKKGLSYSIEYQAKHKTLTDEEVDSLHQQIRDTLRRRLGAEIR